MRGHCIFIFSKSVFQFYTRIVHSRGCAPNLNHSDEKQTRESHYKILLPNYDLTTSSLWHLTLNYIFEYRHEYCFCCVRGIRSRQMLVISQCKLAPHIIRLIFDAFYIDISTPAVLQNEFTFVRI